MTTSLKHLENKHQHEDHEEAEHGEVAGHPGENKADREDEEYRDEYIHSHFEPREGALAVTGQRLALTQYVDPHDEHLYIGA